MAITVAMRTQVAQLYASLFGRAPEATGLGFWVTKLGNGETFASIAQQMFAVDAARAYYPSFLTNGEIVAKFYTNVLGRTADADGLAFWTAKLDAKGATPGSVIAEMINTVAGYTGTDAAGLASQAFFNAKTDVGLYYAVTLQGNDVAAASTVMSKVTYADPAGSSVIAKGVADVAANPPAVGQTLTLTVSATDVPKGGAADDTIIGQIGQSTTLQASDSIDGGAGNDTLRVVTDGAAAASVGGFTTNNVETLEVQSQATGGTTLGLENATGLKTIRSSSSNTDLTVNNVKNLVGLDVVGSLNNQNITVNYQAAVVSGSTDTQAVTLNGNSLGTLTVNGVETLAASTATAASTVATLTGDKFAKVTVAGDKGFTVTNALPATITSVDASAQTAGGVTVTLTNAADVAVKGGAGNDSVTFTGALTSADSFDGGAGTDTVTANTAEFTGSTYAVASKITNVEVLGFADQISGTFDASKFAGENTYRLNAGFAAATTIDKADDASTVNVRAASAGNTLTYNILNATDTGTANTVNIQVGGANGVNAGTIATAGVETVNLTSNGSATTAGGNTLTITDVAATKLTIAGVEDLTLTLTGTALSTVDASTATGNLDLSAVTYKASTSATITGGAGKDSINGSAAADVIVGGAGNDVLAGGAGADTLTGGAGADTFSFNTVSDSSGSTLDVITDFVSGTDLINVTNLANSTGRTTVVLKNGAAADFGSAQAAIALSSGTTQVVFQADTNTLWVDLNDDGTLNNNDLAIKLTGVTKVVAADVGGTATPGGTGNYINLTGTTAVVNATTNTLASAVSTTFNDTINTAIANVAGSTVDGLAGTDSLVLTTAGAVGALPATITNVETLQLASVGTTANTGVAFNAAGAFLNVTGSSNDDTIASTANLLESGTINLGAGNDTITALTLFDTAAHAASTSYKFNINMGAGDDAVTNTTALVFTADSVLNGGDGTDTLTLATTSNIAAGSVTNFENLTTAGTASMTLAQYNSFTGTITSGGVLTLTTAGTVNNAVGAITLANGTNTVNTASAGTQALVGGTGTDYIKITAAYDPTADTITDATTTDSDTVEFAYNVGATLDLNTTGAALVKIENVKITGTQAAALALTLDGENLTLDASGVAAATAITLATTLAAGTSFKLGAGNDVVTAMAANTVAQTLDLGAGNDTITALRNGTGALTVAPGQGTLTVTDIAAHGTGAITFQFAAPTSGTLAGSIGTATANLAVGDIFDFATNVTSIIVGKADGTTGVAGASGQVFMDLVTTAGATIITFDADGSRTFTAGDVQITVVGNVLGGSIDANGNLLVGSSA